VHVVEQFCPGRVGDDSGHGAPFDERHGDPASTGVTKPIQIDEIIGLVDGEDVLGLFPVNPADNVLHIVLTVAAFAAALARDPSVPRLGLRERRKDGEQRMISPIGDG
jgi:hypothetical protein